MNSHDLDHFDASVLRALAESGGKILVAQEPIDQLIKAKPKNMQHALRKRACLLLGGTPINQDFATAQEDQRVRAILGLQDVTCTQTPRYRRAVRSDGNRQSRRK